MFDPPIVTLVLPHKERFGPLAAGAVAMVVRRLARVGSRHKSRVIGPAFDGPAFPGIDFLSVTTPAWLPATPTHRYALSLAMALRSLPPGPVEVHNKPDVAMVLARLFPRRPVTLFLHNDPRTMRGADLSRARARLSQQLARIVCVSRYVRDCWQDGAAVSAVSRAAYPVVIHNAIDHADLPPAVPVAARERLILFAGRVVEEKAPDAYVHACAAALPRLPGWRAEIIGASGFSATTSESEFIRGLRPVAAAAGITWHGYRPHAEVLQALTRAAIVVVPSRWNEPFGLSALEAMACGAVVVCSNRGGLAEVTGDAAVEIDPDDPVGIADVLVDLAADLERRQTLVALAHRRVHACFSLRCAIERLDDLRDGVIVEWELC